MRKKRGAMQELNTQYLFPNRLHFTLAATTAVLFATLLAGVTDASAQKIHTKARPQSTASTRRTQSLRPVSKHNASSQTGQAVKSLLSSQTPAAPVSIVNLANPDFLSGEASVTVNPKQPTVIRLGLAQNAVSMVEFPASDGIYYIHEGNPKLASVFQSPTRETDRSITIYPGEGFLSERGAASPSAAITLQMRSGLVLILELVPVADLRQNAHRCVINYNRDEVISARRAAGLAYDLGDNVKTNQGRTTKASSQIVDQSPDIEGEKGDETTSPGPARTVSVGMLKNAGRTDNSNRPTKPKSGADLSLFANKKLAECLRNPLKQLGAWSPSESGLTMAISRIADLDAERRLVIVAIKNETTGNLWLVPGSPELQIQTSDAKGNSLQTTRLERLYVESTSLEGMIQPGSTVYYALVYKAPIVGINQSVRVLVSHREAADAPAAISLQATSKNKE
jgi:hypothetical protein